MRVDMKTTYAGPAGTFGPGQTDVPDDIAEGLVKAGYATSVRAAPRRATREAAEAATPAAGEDRADGAGDTVEEPAGDVEPGTIEIPEDWRDFLAEPLKELANRFAEEPVSTKAEAIEVIEAELARRAAD